MPESNNSGAMSKPSKLQQVRFRLFWLRYTFEGFWQQNSPVAILAAVVLGCTITAMTVFLPKADAASLRSSLVITASSCATFLGFIFVSLAILAGRATSISERLLDLWRLHDHDLSSRIESLLEKCTDAIQKEEIKLDWQAKPFGHPDFLSSRRWNRKALIRLGVLRASMLARTGDLKPGLAEVVLGSLGLTDSERHYVDLAALTLSQSATRMWDAMRHAIADVQNSEFMTINEVHDQVMYVRSVLFKNEIFDALETIAQRRRASGPLFWWSTAASILTISVAFLVGSGITDDTISNVEIRMAFNLAMGLWWIAVTLVLAYVRQVLRE